MKPGVAAALEHPADDLYARAVVANVKYNVEQLQQAKPIIATMVADKKLLIVGGVYDLATGKVVLV